MHIWSERHRRYGGRAGEHYGGGFVERVWSGRDEQNCDRNGRRAANYQQGLRRGKYSASRHDYAKFYCYQSEYRNSSERNRVWRRFPGGTAGFFAERNHGILSEWIYLCERRVGERDYVGRLARGERLVHIFGECDGHGCGCAK